MDERTKYKFVGRRGQMYVWESTTTVGPTDSRHPQISAPIDWYWNPDREGDGDDE